MGKVVRCVLATPAEFLDFWKAHGPFHYALHQDSDGSAVMAPDEWLFSDDLFTLMKIYLQWDARQMRMVWDEPSAADKAAGMIGAWYAENLPDDWDPPFFDAPPETTVDEAEQAFLLECAVAFEDEHCFLENFRLPSHRDIFLRSLEDWREALDAPPLDTRDMLWPPAPDTAARPGAPWGLCPWCGRGRIREPFRMGLPGAAEQKPTLARPVYWTRRSRVRPPRLPEVLGIVPTIGWQPERVA